MAGSDRVTASENDIAATLSRNSFKWQYFQIVRRFPVVQFQSRQCVARYDESIIIQSTMSGL